MVRDSRPNRRRFIVSLAGAAAALRLSPTFDSAAQLQAAFGPVAGLPPFPFAGLAADFLATEQRRPTRAQRTGVTRAIYLEIIDGIARFFASHQDERGAIIDPYERKEKQYSTPAFALAAAVLSASGRNKSLLAATIKAMEAACADLAAGKAADGHADFFTVLLVHADRVLAPMVGQASRERWRGSLRAITPGQIYRYQPTAENLHNWNVVAAAGEFLRTRDGFGASTEWVEASLARQMEHFTPAGMYRDPSDPLAYDHFARLWALDMAEEGYRGARADKLDALLERGAWLSLFMQSPHGELPCGGRSAHHQWNEAEQAVTFETFARRYRQQGNLRAARIFTRAARLSLRSIARWVRPSGELWIVKNRLDPALRHGYEYYSFHSQYNLLTAAMLALAWLRASDGADEQACPADTGGYAFALQPAFHKVFAAASGYYVEIDTGADLHYNPTGILRIQHGRLPPETISDGVTPQCDYTVPSRPSRAFAVGPQWQDARSEWHALASHGAGDLEPTDVRVVRASRQDVEVLLEYRGRLRGGATAVRERIAVSALGVRVEHAVEGNVSAVRQTVPVLVDDGRTQSQITVRKGRVEVARGTGRLAISVGAGAATTCAFLREPCRNGFADAVVVEGTGRECRCLISADDR
jgi:hypothetical protein